MGCAGHWMREPRREGSELRAMKAADPKQKQLLQSALGLEPGQRPYPWQESLLERMLKGDVPELVDIPTGLGKTSVIAIWLVARACGASLPPRLVYCLPMRVLVRQTRERAVRWAHNLGLLAGQAEFDGNHLKSYTTDWSNPNRAAVVTLMGGEAQDEWREHPERPAIIVGTQDMLLSRALNRGFAMAPQLWPVDFGFLNTDALWVMDEAQLMGPGRTTSVQLQHFWDEKPSSYGARRTLWMSATLGSQPGSREQPAWMKTPERKDIELSSMPHTHSDADVRHGGFNARWKAPKRLELHLEPSTWKKNAQTGARKRARSSSKSSANSDSAWTAESEKLIEQIQKEAAGGRLVLVLLNQVKRACTLYERLRQLRDAGNLETDLVLIHARMRPRDRREQEAKLETPVPSGGRIVVTTQVLEAGVDIDADALFTELCPWSSLVQRFGRLNRSGTRPSVRDIRNGREPAIAVVFEPVPPLRKQTETPKQYEERRRREAARPYDPEALEEARKYLDGLMRNHAGSLSLETLAKLQVSLPVEGPVLRRFDLDDLFDTDPDLSGGYSDVSPFIRAVDRDVDAYVLWRRIKEGANVADRVPIHPDELCPVPFYEVQKAFKDRDVWILTLASGRKRGAAWRKAHGSDIKPGDTVMVDVSAGSYSEETGWNAGSSEGPAVIVDRWTRPDGTVVRAWVRLDGRTPQLVEEIDDRVQDIRARGEDPRSFTKCWMELDRHLKETEVRAEELTKALPGPLKESVVLAARWHDAGKALERETNGHLVRPFQKMLREAGRLENGHPRDDILYAKSNGSGGRPAGFRHELASLLAFLQTNQKNDDLAAFLILAHHGKVRLLPEAWDDEDPSDLCGVRAGDRIPGTALPVSVNGPVVLDPNVLLPSPRGPGWQGRVHRLLKAHGPFLLAYLEGLVRVADWRAS
jgi:CRISPR-associated endonuclease/helicase Cas3